MNNQKDYTITNFKIGDRAVILDASCFDEKLREKILKTNPELFCTRLTAGWYKENKYGRVDEINNFNYVDGTPGTEIMIKCYDGFKIRTWFPENIRKPNPLELLIKKFD